MNYRIMLGLAAVAVAALMAFAGAGTASADELCTAAANAENMCPEGKKIAKIEASLVGSAKLEDTSKNVLDTCTAGTVKITNLKGNETFSSAITGESPKEDITWGTETTKCTFPTVTIANGTASGQHAEGGGTTIKASGAEVTINTVLFGTCVYGVGASLDLGKVNQGTNTLAINTAVVKISGLCPNSSIWNATYKVTNHLEVFYITN